MTYNSVLSSKGQVTVPQGVRSRLGLKEGDRIEFVLEGGLTIIRPGRTAPNPFAAYAGVLSTFPGGADEINAWISELRDGDPASENSNRHQRNLSALVANPSRDK